MENNYFVPVFARTGSSPFKRKWRGARSKYNNAFRWNTEIMEIWDDCRVSRLF